MTPKSRIRMVCLSMLAGILIFACSLAGSAPTATPEPPTATPLPTNTQEPPTATPEPTLAPTEAPTEGSSEPEPTESSTTSDNTIQIAQVHGYYDLYDTLNIVGLVTNNTERAIDNVEIEVEVFDANDASLYAETVYIDLYTLARGETSPFSLAVYEDLPEADNFVATVVGNSSADVNRATLDVENTLLTIDDDGLVHVTGELFNNTAQPIEISALAGAVFDSTGALILAESYNTTIRYLDPGDSGPFRITMTGPNSGSDTITDFEIYVDAEFTDPIDALGITIGDATNYKDSLDYFHLVGEATNNGTKTYNIRLVAGIYDSEGKVVDAAYIDLPINALAPGETSPYDFDYWGPLNTSSSLFDAAETYSIQVDAYWTWETDTELIDLTTQNDTNTFDDFGATFTGEVVNGSGGPIASAIVVVYLVDKQSNVVVATDYTYLYEEIADGKTLEYTIYLDPEVDFDPDSAEYYIIVKGQRP